MMLAIGEMFLSRVSKNHGDVEGELAMATKKIFCSDRDP
jgi:hypothetical protein